jgi:hypothetical protein
MAIRDVQRGASGLRTVINDSRTVGTPTATGLQENRILVLGFFKSGKDANGEDIIPVQEVYPERPGQVDLSTLLRQTMNYSDDASPVAYPSEVSILLEELQRGGANNVQVVRIGDDARYMDVTSRQARDRFIALENAYDLVQDRPFDNIIPCNVVAGKHGDGLYSGNTLGTSGESVTVVYDPDLYDEVVAANPNDPRLKVTSLYGFVAGDEVNYLKGDGTPDARVEDLAYQAADAAQTITENGNRCTAILRTMNPIEVRHLKRMSLGDNAVAGTNFGAGAPVVTGVTSDDSWALCRYKGKFVGEDGTDLDFAGTDTAMTNEDVLALIEENAYFADRATNASLDAGAGVPTVKAVFREVSQPVYAAGSVSQADVVAWSLAFGAPSRGEVKKWTTFVLAHGNGSADVFQNSVCSFVDMDGMTSATGEAPDNFLFYATTDHEKPYAATDTDIVGDENEVAIDLGAYVDLLAANSILPTGPNAKLISSSVPKSFSFGAGLGEKGGLYSTLPNNRSALAITTQNLLPLGLLGGREIQGLVRRGIQVFRDEDGVYTFQNDVTKARWVNDFIRSKFTNRLTTRIQKQAQDVAMAEGKRLRGLTDTPENLAGLEQRITSQLSEWQNPEDGRLRANGSLTVSVSSTAAGEAIGRLLIRLDLPIQGEIQQISVTSDVSFA